MNHQIDDRKKCELCNRKFASDRLEKHIEVCKKQKEKKRTTFDSFKQRQIIDQNDENGDSMNKSKITKSKAKIVKPVTRPIAKPSSINSSNKTNTNKLTNGIKKTVKEMNGSEINNKNGLENGKTNGNTNEIINEINSTNNQDDKKSKWRENHEEFIKSIQSVKKINGNSLDSNDEKMNKQNESMDKIDKESTITVNSDSTTSTGNGTVNTNGSTGSFNANEKSTDEDNQINGNSEKSKPTQRKIQPPQSRLNKNKLNQLNGQQLNKQSNGQIMMNGSTTNLNSANSNHNSNNVGTKKSMNTVECTICGRKFNRAAGERHIPWCAEKSQRKNSSNNTNEEALARFRARNAYRSTKGLKKRERDKSVPNEKKEDKYIRQSSLRRALSTIDGLDQVFNNKVQLNNSTNLNNKRSTSQVSLNRQSKYKDNHQMVKKLQINAHSKSNLSSASSSKGSTQHNTNHNNTNNNNNNYSAGFREQAQSRVKARLNQQQKIQKQRMNSTYPKTPIMKFKDRFPNHSNKLIEFADSQQFSQMFKKHLNNSTELNNMPKTVPGVRTGGLSPTKDMHRNNGHHIEDMNDLEQLRARIKEMYLSSNNGNHSQNDLLDYHLTNHNELNDTSFTRENSSSKIKSSKSVNDFLSDGFNDFINDIDLPKTCHQCQTGYITMSARYCYSCGARRLLL